MNSVDINTDTYNCSNGSTINSSDDDSWNIMKQTKSLEVPHEKRITFCWCNINAFGQQPPLEFDKSRILSILGNEKSAASKHILKNVTGAAYPGEFLVMMGASGAGKTTLLNCLTFRNLKSLKISGLVCINNERVTQTQLAAQSAYIQQDDLFIKCLTVREHLTFQSKLRMSSMLSPEERQERIEEVMRELSLKEYEFCQIGYPGTKGISVAERKKLALASELLTNPSLLFCDEPTTGLDSFTSTSVFQILKNLSKTGRTVVATVHQPSSELFYMFDKLLLMAEGRTAFLGTIAEASTFFTKLQVPCPRDFSPADYYIQLLAIAPGREETCRQFVNSICDAFQASTLGARIKSSAEKTMKSVQDLESSWTPRRGHVSPYKVGWWTQMRAVFWRTWISLIKNHQMVSCRLITTSMEVLAIALIFYHQTLNQFGIKNLDGELSFLVISTSFLNVFAVVDSFCGEFPIFMKEHKDGMYRTDVYYISKIVCDIPLSLILTFLSITICYYVTGLNPGLQTYLKALLICLLTCLAGQGAGYVVSTIAPNSLMTLPLVDAMVEPLLLLGGIFLNSRSIPSYLHWLSDLSWFKYAYEALLINQWSDIRHIPCDTNLTSLSMCIPDGLGVLQSQLIDPGNFWPDVGTICVLVILLRIVAFCVLLYKAYGKD